MITKHNFLHIFISGAIALTLVIFIRIFFFQTFVVPSTSMYPLLTEGDKILALKNYLFRDFKKGDIIVFSLGDKYLVKRIVALENERVLIRDRDLSVDGKKNLMFDNIFDRLEYHETTVGKDMVYVLGDNISKSEDSRYFGSVPVKNIKGRVICIFAPFQRMSFTR